MHPFIDIHTHHDYTNQGSTLFIKNILLPTQKIPYQGLFSAGWHPWYIENITLKEIESVLDEVLLNENMAAIGECGLDRAIETPLHFQKEVFNLHLEKAEMKDKPVIVHCVKAYSDLLEILKVRQPRQAIILHDFHGNLQQIDQLLKYNTYFSIGEINEKQKRRKSASLQHIPLNRLFLETDESLVPIASIYQTTAKMIGITLDDFKSQVFANYKTVFVEGAEG